jgi:hypothetical protein
MSHGFEFFDSSGNKTLSQLDIAIQFIGLFSVSPTSTGSQNFPNIGFSNVVAVATADEPVISNAASFLSANYINLSTTINSSTITVNWSPRYRIGDQYDVNIYVFGY